VDIEDSNSENEEDEFEAKNIQSPLNVAIQALLRKQQIQIQKMNEKVIIICLRLNICSCKERFNS
jgi:hypothetical protein